MSLHAATSTVGAVRRRYADALELTAAGAPIAGVLFGWFLLRELGWLDETALLACGLLSATVVAVRRGRRLRAVPLGDDVLSEHGRILLGVLPWFVALPALGALLEGFSYLHRLLDTLSHVLHDVAAWTGAGVVLVYVVAVLSTERVASE